MEAEVEYLQLIAPWIPAWGFETENAAGEVVAVPAPGEMPGNEEVDPWVGGTLRPHPWRRPGYGVVSGRPAA